MTDLDQDRSENPRNSCRILQRLKSRHAPEKRPAVVRNAKAAAAKGVPAAPDTRSLAGSSMYTLMTGDPSRRRWQRNANALQVRAVDVIQSSQQTGIHACSET